MLVCVAIFGNRFSKCSFNHALEDNSSVWTLATQVTTENISLRGERREETVKATVLCFPVVLKESSKTAFIGCQAVLECPEGSNRNGDNYLIRQNHR